MKSTSTLVAITLCFAAAGTESALSAQKCGGSDIANGPFTYETQGLTQTTFSGTGGASVPTSFNVTAPSPSQDTTDPDVFPGQGAENQCASTAIADIGVLEIQKVADASGAPLLSVDIDLTSPLGNKIATAFLIAPVEWINFLPGNSKTVEVTVNNPNVDAADYGTYSIKLAAKADGYGIGVGPGETFTLIFSAPTVSDTVPPTVNITKPIGDEILGVTGVEVKAADPASPGATGLASLTAKVSSAGGVVSNLPITLTLDTPLTALPGVEVTGTGSFGPTGGPHADSQGTTDVLAFTGGARSGIGNYTITATAEDGVGLTTTATKNFNVKYQVDPTTLTGQTNGVCSSTATSGNPANCSGTVKFTVKRSNATSDGAFMFDHTVEVDIVRKSDSAVMATHAYGTGALSSNTQIDTTNLLYQTVFTRGDLYSSLCSTQTCLRTKQSTYNAKVYFKDVDNNRVIQFISDDVTF